MNKILVELKRREGDLNNMQKENSELQSTNLTLEEKLSETISKYDELVCTLLFFVHFLKFL
jgi:hypothetical protein